MMRMMYDILMKKTIREEIDHIVRMWKDAKDITFDADGDINGKGITEIVIKLKIFTYQEALKKIEDLKKD